MNTDQLTQIGMIILGLGIAWIVLSTVLKLAKKVLSCGCGLILALGALLFLLNYFRGS